MKPTSVELRQITKSFPGVLALSNVSLKAYAGECLGLVGENGAGKSTLMKVLSGIWPSKSYSGEILIEGHRKDFFVPQDARDSGVAIIHQELALFPELSVAENILISELPHKRGRLKKDELFKQSKEILDQLNLNISPLALVKDLSIGQRQLVEIARAFTRPLKVLVLDEPSSALTDRETEKLFELVDRLKREGVCCLYISHKLPEIRRLCERVVILRDGQSVKTFDSMDGVTDDLLISQMVGRQVSQIFPEKAAPKALKKPLLQVKNLSYRHPRSGKSLLKDLTFEVYEGEVLGVAGLVGSRRTDLLMALFGALPAHCHEGGEVYLDEKLVRFRSPREAIQNKIALVTEDRKASGLILDRSIRENLSLPFLDQLTKFFKIQQAAEKEMAEKHCKEMRVKTPSTEFFIKNLSGGNQQKVILARWLATKPRLLLLDEPTRGIDVGAKSEIYHMIRKLASEGLAIIMVSSELPEVLHLSDRVIVMHEGRASECLTDQNINAEKIMERAVAG